jgi:hypothetical protein
MITITNNFKDKVCIRVSNQSGSDTEEQVISSFSSFSWEREDGDYFIGVKLYNSSNPESIATISSPCLAEIEPTSQLRCGEMFLPYNNLLSFKPTRFDPLLKSNEKSCIEIRNNYPSGIYVRIGGDLEDDGLKYIEKGDTAVFYRLGGEKYDLQVVFNESDPYLYAESQIYSVFPPCVYQFRASSEPGMEDVIVLIDNYGSYVTNGWKFYKP